LNGSRQYKPDKPCLISQAGLAVLTQGGNHVEYQLNTIHREKHILAAGPVKQARHDRKPCRMDRDKRVSYVIFPLTNSAGSF
jgi:hypothetical protein